LHQISGQTDTASVPLENNQALLDQAIAPQVIFKILCSGGATLKRALRVVVASFYFN